MSYLARLLAQARGELPSVEPLLRSLYAEPDEAEPPSPDGSERLALGPDARLEARIETIAAPPTSEPAREPARDLAPPEGATSPARSGRVTPDADEKAWPGAPRSLEPLRAARLSPSLERPFRLPEQTPDSVQAEPGRPNGTPPERPASTRTEIGSPGRPEPRRGAPPLARSVDAVGPPAVRVASPGVVRSATPPTVHVTIGRIEVRASAATAAPPAPRRRAPTAALSLEDFLDRDRRERP